MMEITSVAAIVAHAQRIVARAARGGGEGDRTMAAFLPENKETRTIEQMVVGEVAYTVPWAMFATRRRQLWLNPGYSVYEKPHGTVCMQVAKTDAGYEVDASACDGHTWEPRDTGEIGSGWDEQIPVASIKW